jgi:hypothetical protein
LFGIDIELPPEDERQLIAMDAIPNWHGVRPRKWMRDLHDIRGPELINNELIHKQFGLIVITFTVTLFQYLINFKI